MTPAFWRLARGISLFLITTVPAGAQTTSPAIHPARAGAQGLRLTFLGTAGWEITDGRLIVLVDPFLSKDAIVAYARAKGTEPLSDPDAVITPDTASIDARIKRADYVLITHGHADHALDALHIARKLGAVIVGHESVASVARAYGIPDSSLITVRGGEDYEFGNFSLRVIPSIHSALNNKRYFNRPVAGTNPRGLEGPIKVRYFVEGGSLAYLLRFAGYETLIMGSMNYLEREMDGLRPDIALVGANGNRRQIYNYAARLMRALGQPALVLPTHCCDTPTDEEARGFEREVKAASPRTRVVIPTRYEPIVVPPPR